MDVVLVVADPDRAEALEKAAHACGHRTLRLPRAFNRALDALNQADVVVADFVAEPVTAAWCLAYALARTRLAVASTSATHPLPAIVRENPSPYQRTIVGEPADAARALAELLRV